MDGAGMALPAVTLSEAQAYVRIETGEEEAVLAGLIRMASALCEAFIGQVVIARPFEVLMTADARWQRIETGPVRSIDRVETPDSAALPASSYAIDIDANGDGWVRVSSAAGERVRVIGTAGMAADQNGVPEPVRQGVLRLVAHLFASRDGDGGAPPAAVTALWRPYRRMRLA